MSQMQNTAYWSPLQLPYKLWMRGLRYPTPTNCETVLMGLRSWFVSTNPTATRLSLNAHYVILHHYLGRNSNRTTPTSVRKRTGVLN